ncbi:flagellar biosynthesis protein FlhF [Cohnella cholangitidis]|uniref:Flagellar biosynthesis protein FlhF n=1 Tax=Cohnella cholangitidis TaxID=2598458 RepID=A0A7G5BT69_9BACL|nr:flagellar biosynthesis protein FlhF [Cohnella cholangitidis]QMV40153.1 flagellar biosynthesis protein FlhF [Cohnella cholangitidis]
MKVKRYIVDDVPEAVQMIRSELGSDAVILNTKEIRVGGFLGMFRKKRMEVIAAIDEAAKKPPARSPLPSRSPLPDRLPDRKPYVPPAEEQATSSPVLPSNTIRERYSQPPFADSGRAPLPSPIGLADIQTDSGQAGPTKMSAFGSSLELAKSAQERSAPLPEIRPEPAFTDNKPEQPRTSVQASTLADDVLTAQTRGNKQEVEETSALLQELRSMKELMTKMAKQQTYRSMPESVMKWSKRLAEQGVEPAYVEQFAEAVSHRLADLGEESVEASYQAARAELLSWLHNAKDVGIDAETRIIHFVGPTGVGKTTTIAKLAAEQSFNHRRSVGFITADTYRIAAVDQLRTYADILNIPLEVVFSPGELTRAYKKMSDQDLIFMDTAGRNYRNELFVSEVNSLLAPGEQTQTILVLSLTHKYSDMKTVASQFVKYGVNQLLLTKFDETDSYGSVINLVREFDFRISYITFGQTVPDDIKAFEPEDLVKRILGDPTDD